MNKKAEIATATIIWVIFAVIAGLFVANQAGLFSITPPSVDTNTPSQLINNYYYGDAVENYQFDCAMNSLVFRSASTSWGSTSNWIVLFRDGVYKGYSYSANVKQTSTPGIAISGVSPNVYENGNDLYIFNQDLSEQTGLCLRCQSETNPVLYKDISPGLCNGVSQNFVNFRTTSQTYSSGSSVGYTDIPGGDLTPYSYYSGSGTIASCSNYVTGLGASQIFASSPGSGAVYKLNEFIYVCNVANNIYKTFSSSPAGTVSTNPAPTGTNELTYTVSYPTCTTPQYETNKYYFKYSNTGETVASSNEVGTVVSGTNEIWNDGGSGTQPYIWGSPKYACNANGDIVLQYCKQNGTSTVLQDCASNQACQFYPKSSTIGVPGLEGNYDSVKCGSAAQSYVPNKQICNVQKSGFSQTNSDGTDITFPTCPTSYGGTCVQDTDSTAHCTECGIGAEKCTADYLTAQDCSASGTWQTKSSCTGDTTCQMVATTATCQSGVNPNSLRCIDANSDGVLEQRQKRNLANDAWINNGDACSLECSQTDNSKCTDNCNWNGYTGIGSCSVKYLTYCDISNPDTGKVIRTNSPYTRKECTWGSCNAEGSACSFPYTLGRTYCRSQSYTYLEEAVQDTGSDTLVSGGVKLSKVTPECNPNYGCTESSPTAGFATCNLDSRCKIAGQQICLTQNQIGVCSANGYVNNGAACLDSEHKFCDDSAQSVTPTANAVCSSSQSECTGTLSCKDGATIWGCSSGYRTTQLDDCNSLGCTETVAGQPQCNPDSLCTGRNFSGNFFACQSSSKISYSCISDNSNDYDGKQLIRDLTQGSERTCSNGCLDTAIDANRCLSSCTSGVPICSGTDAIRDCINGEPASSDKWTCNSLGCTAGKCNDDSFCIGSGLTGNVGFKCDNTNQVECYKDTTSNQILKRVTDCTNGCDSVTGKCLIQCTGTSQCYNGKIYGCNSVTQERSNIIDECMGLGCTETVVGQPKCNNGCNPSDVDKNIACLNANDEVVSSIFSPGSKSIICTKNATNSQYYNQTVNCGVAGCSNNKCIGNLQYANSFYCTGNNEQEIYATDAGGVPITFVTNCKGGNWPAINNLEAYCKNGRGVCTYCELNGYYCIPSTKTQFQCANEISGAIQGSAYCDAGCGTKTNGAPYCDELSVVINGATTFPTIGDTDLGDIDLTGILKGSVSGLPISGASISASISGSGINQTALPLVSANDGTFNIPFHSYNKGSYTITITVNGFTKNNIVNRNVMITNSFIVSPYESQTIYLIPGVSPIFKVKAKNERTGAVPDDLKVSSFSNITVYQPKRSSSDTSIWEVTLGQNSPVGQYEIGLKPSQGGTTLDEQFVSIEIAKPALTATLNNPTSTTTGKKEYKLQVSGPKFENGMLTTGALKPDVNPKATITYNSQTSNLNILDNGGGEYLISYDFKDVGTYTINIEASKAGYETAKIAPIVQVSDSGTEAPPATDGSGTKAVSTGIITDIGSSTTTWIIVGVLAVIGFLIFRRKR